MKLLLCACAVLALPVAVHAGGVLKVAGSGFDSSVNGKPLTWPNGVIVYYTDQGDLSPALLNAQADAFVADAFSRWTSVPTAALSATHGGALAEDVNGSNVSVSGLPADIQPTATAKPIAVVYDLDGSVTDALLGVGSKSHCADNSAFGGTDANATDGHFSHALVVLNGTCVQAASDIPEFRYHVLRVLGRTLGLGWSQLNDNVRSQSPTPTVPELNGYPLMHAMEWTCVGGIVTCLTNPDTLREDDLAAISRLYPVTAQNLSSFPGKSVFADSTIRIHGRVLFPGRTPYAMQGVNVVARYVDNNGNASGQFSSSNVSGFLFRGNAGNAITGFNAPTGERYDTFGSDDLALAGFFDLPGLQLPPGVTSGTIELSVQPVNPLFTGSRAVGALSVIVAPSGNAQPIRIANLSPGADVVQDIVMKGASNSVADAFEPNPIATSKKVPATGSWVANLFGYADTDFSSFKAQANHSIGVLTTALDEFGFPSSLKARPITGIWQQSSIAIGSPLADSGAFNGTATSILNFIFPTDGTYKLGVLDERGDGRPDFNYRVRALYAASASPTRFPSQANAPLLISGFGFNPASTVTVGGASAQLLTASPTELLVLTPQISSGTQPLVVRDPASGVQSTFPNAVRFGAASGDHLEILSQPSSTVSTGGEADHEFSVRALDAANLPIPGLVIPFTITPDTGTLLACNATTCNVAADAQGRASSGVVLRAAGSYTVAASLASDSRAIQLTAVSESGRVLAYPSQIQVIAGSSPLLPLRFRVLANGVPQSGVSVTVSGTSVNPPTIIATTDANGDATTNVTANSSNGSATIVGCRTATTTCATVSVSPTSVASLVVQKISGDAQLLKLGPAAQTILVRVTDGIGTPVFAVPVTFTVSVFPRTLACSGETCDHAVIKPVSTATIARSTDLQGLASVIPVLRTDAGPVYAIVTATAGGISTSFRIDALK